MNKHDNLNSAADATGIHALESEACNHRRSGLRHGVGGCDSDRPVHRHGRQDDAGKADDRARARRLGEQRQLVTRDRASAERRLHGRRTAEPAAKPQRRRGDGFRLPADDCRPDRPCRPLLRRHGDLERGNRKPEREGARLHQCLHSGRGRVCARSRLHPARFGAGGGAAEHRVRLRAVSRSGTGRCAAVCQAERLPERVRQRSAGEEGRSSSRRRRRPRCSVP